MQKLKADTDIESGKFEKVYLLYGDEPYLVRTYKNRLRKAIIPEEGSMNYAYYDSMPDNVETVTEFADTLPFFGDRRLVILDKTNAFKKDTGLADYIPNVPDFSTIIIVEDEIDKRSRLYKAISKCGCVMELKKLKAAKDADTNTLTVPENVVRERPAPGDVIGIRTKTETD